MEDHQNPEAVAGRASQEDPIVMYLIVHESLNMSAGKTAAQCAHASQMLTLKYFEMKDELNKYHKLIVSITDDSAKEAMHNKRLDVSRKVSIFGEWMASSYRKVVLRASDKDWDKLKEEFKDQMVMVVDAGLTEIASGSETVIGLFPMRKSQRPKILQRLQVLK
jgi:peptidyl-tRNA hydrolase, PTH2 family